MVRTNEEKLELKSQVKALPYPFLLTRQTEIQSRLSSIGIHDDDTNISNNKANNNNDNNANHESTPMSIPTRVPSIPKTDIHWDFVMKELAWLATDFQSERKRQTSLAKKQALSIKQYHSTKEKRALRKIAELELRKRRLASKLARDVVKGWWEKKIERVIAYKQKVDADLVRKRGMDRHLVFLVQQTERYTELLNQQLVQKQKDRNGGGTEVDGGDEMKEAVPMLTIEEALHQSDFQSVSRNKRQRYLDYQTLAEKLGTDEREFYGELTTDDEGESELEDYIPNEDEELDDETTFIEAELMDAASTSHQTLVNEALLLKEESEMDIEDLLKRLEAERDHALAAAEEQGSGPKGLDQELGHGASDNETAMAMRAGSRSKRVKFAMELSTERTIPAASATAAATTTTTRSKAKSLINDGNVADDDADMSDVDDFASQVDSVGSIGSDGSDEFSSNPLDCIDDETTLDAEMRLNPDMNPDDEIALLQKEAEMSVEELRAMYAAASSMGDQGDGESNTEQEEEGLNIDDAHNESSTAANGTDDDISAGSTSSGSEEFEDDVQAADDETTIAAEENLGRDMSYEDEIALLEQENEMSIEELKAMYQNIQGDNDVDDDDNKNNDDTVLDDGSANDEQSDEDPFAADDQAVEDEFKPDNTDVDDETTMEAEERLGREMSYKDEIALLEKENEMSVEELRAVYFKQEDDSSDTKVAGNDINADEDAEANTEEDNISAASDSQDEAEFEPSKGADIDDETTIEAEECLGRDMTHEEEIKMLEKESEMPIEQLRVMYANQDEEDMAENDDRSSTSSHESTDQIEADGDSQESKKRKLHSENEILEEEEEVDEGAVAMKSLEYADAKARNTAVSRPYLLSSWVKLREYQHVGLNWLVSIQTRRLNGILADEMGLGKTLQTIALLSYLAAYKGIWGPHLIIVPTSCIVNWEVEIKRFCPAFKVLCYYGSAKRRKELRQGWTKTNWHHIVITSYQLAVQDAFAFKRKKWYYLILDEAHNIKNFQSQRWQTLVNFNTQRRLLLTGTPLQNNLMELWSLLHFLMPHVFRSRKEFSYWFSNPMNNIIEGNSSRNDDLIGRLHGIIRPFVLRRLKKDVETQMPGKYEHIVKCHLSRRQMFLYEEFMARSSTRVALQKGGNYMGMMNVLMQLRKVCNHPDLFEARSVVTPFSTERISIVTASIVVEALHSDYPLERVSSKLLHPLWSISCGEPSCEEAIKQSQSISDRRKKLKVDSTTLNTMLCKNRLGDSAPEVSDNPGLSLLLKEIHMTSEKECQHKARLQCSLNDGRCDGHAFLYSSTLQDAAKIDIFSLKSSSSPEFTHKEVLCTPSSLLEMRRGQEREREIIMKDLQKNFVFYVPNAGSQKPLLFPKSRSELDEDKIKKTLGGEVDLSGHNSNALFFPDKKLIQFDAGKLQILSELLRNLKQGKHRVLIFTQMSKMLDILEAFLNLNGHTYVRLDGATSVDQRQRLMDRFNHDEKIFVFILSTRSGGLGINLTGADTVVFYDSDWNPAMDAQAQDRAHRIGQTRDVHIYRLVTEHSIEENILVKAKQKKHLDFLVMDEGKFHAAQKDSKNLILDDKGADTTTDDEAFDISSKGGLRSILGIATDDKEEDKIIEGDENPGCEDNIESAMAAFEDEDDVLAMRGAQQEAKEELQEFDESVQIVKNDEENQEESQDEGAPAKKKAKQATADVPEKEETAEEEDPAAALEKEFAAWQSQVGVDKASIDASLNPVERYALRFKEDIEHFYSMWYLSEQQRIQETESAQEEWDIAEIEAAKAVEESNAIENGDLLATMPEPEELLRQRHLYFREKSRLRANKKKRRLTGENWIVETDGKSKLPFWYNCDTGEALWYKPQILLELEEYDKAADLFWNAMPLKPLVKIMEYLVPFPERMTCAVTCKQWCKAAQDISFVRHVYPVEMGALTMDAHKMHPYHYRTISEALNESLPGDTIELGDGHYWINESELMVNVPLKVIGDEKDPSHVVIELSGRVNWKGSSGFMEGITFRRPRINDDSDEKAMLQLESGSQLSMAHVVFEGAREKPSDVIQERITGSGISVQGRLDMSNCIITKTKGTGIECFGDATVHLAHSRIVGNAGPAVSLKNSCVFQASEDCEYRYNSGGTIKDSRVQ